MTPTAEQPFDALFEDAISACIQKTPQSAAPLRRLLEATPDFDEQLRQANGKVPYFLKECLLRLIKRGPVECLEVLDEYRFSFPGWDQWSEQFVGECLGRDRADVLRWMHARGALRTLRHDPVQETGIYEKAAAVNAVQCVRFLVSAGYRSERPTLALLVSSDAKPALIEAAVEAGLRNEDCGRSDAIIECCNGLGSPQDQRRVFRALLKTTPPTHIPFDAIVIARHLGNDRISLALNAVDHIPAECAAFDDRILGLVPKRCFGELLEKGVDPLHVLSFAARQPTLQPLVAHLYQSASERYPRNAALDVLACVTPAGARAALKCGFDPWQQRPGSGGLPWISSLLVTTSALDLSPLKDAALKDVAPVIVGTLAGEVGTLRNPRTGEHAVVGAMQHVLTQERSLRRSVNILDLEAVAIALEKGGIPLDEDPGLGGTILHAIARHLTDRASRTVLVNEPTWPADSQRVAERIFPLMARAGLDPHAPDAHGKSAVDYLSTDGKRSLEPLCTELCRHFAAQQASSKVSTRKRASGPRL